MYIFRGVGEGGGGAIGPVLGSHLRPWYLNGLLYVSTYYVQQRRAALFQNDRFIKTYHVVYIHTTLSLGWKKIERNNQNYT